MTQGPSANPTAPSSSSSTSVVEVRDLSVIYPAKDQNVVALDHVNLSIREGEFISLLGPSGCGKTTLLRVIADLEQATSGSVQVNGLSAHDARLARAYGYVFQAPALFPWRTVLRNVTLPLEIHGRSAAEADAIAREQLQRVGLTGFEGKYPWQLSGGMQQRVSIARAPAGIGFTGQQQVVEALRPPERVRLLEKLQHGLRTQLGRAMYVAVIPRGENGELATFVRYFEARAECFDERHAQLLVAMM